MVALAKKHGVLSKLVCIGRAITEASVRRKLREADAKDARGRADAGAGQPGRGAG